MSPGHRVAVALVLVMAVGAALAGTGARVEEPSIRFADDGSTTEVMGAVADATTSTASTTTTPVADRLPPLATDVTGAIRSADGTARAVLGTDGEVWVVAGACGGQATEAPDTAVQIGPHHVVLDPAEGGAARGVVAGPVVEADLNLAIARRTAELLADEGVAVVLTRDGDADLGATARGLLGPAVGAEVLVSIHHAAAGDRRTTAPAPEVFHQIDDPASRRLGGLVHEEMSGALAALGGEWAEVEEPGVRPLLNQRGEDFHVVLQRSAGVAAIYVELVALGERETALLAGEEGREIEAGALARAIVRFLVTDEAGDGFVEPDELVREAPTTNAPGACG